MTSKAKKDARLFEFKDLAEMDLTSLWNYKDGEIKREILKNLLEYFCAKDRASLSMLLSHLEEAIIRRSLSRFNGSQKEAAKFLRIKYSTFNQKVKKYNIRFNTRPE